MRTLSLIVPCFNSADLIAPLIAQIPSLQTAAAAAGFELIETILIDDGSVPPLTLKPPAAAITLLRNPSNMGKGYSVRRGALAAHGDFVLMSDMDCSAPLSEFSQLATALGEGVAMVCGSRYCSARIGVPLRRRILSALFRLAVRANGVRGIRDTQCGFKLFNMALMRPIFTAQCINGFAFDVELIRAAQTAGHIVREVPVLWHGGSRSTLRIFTDAPRMLRDLLTTK